MNESFDIDTIRRFLPQTDELLRDFCQYQQGRLETRRGKDLTSLFHYDSFAGRTPPAKANSIIDRMRSGNELPELVEYLTAWWFDVRAGRKDAYAGMSRELCLAAQKLWPSDRDLAISAMDYLAHVAPDLAAAWKPEHFQRVEALDPIRSLDELADHFARCLDLYNQIEGCMASRRWVNALRLWRDLEDRQPGYGEKVFWVNGPPSEETVAALDRILAVAEGGFFYDQHLAWGRSYPYARAQEVGSSITPASSMEEVQLELRERRDMQEDVRASLGLLGRSEAERLFLDLFLYPDKISRDTGQAITETFRRTGRLATSAEIRQAYPEEAALLMVLIDDRDQAAGWWQDMQHRRPLDGRTAHSLGLLSLGSVALPSAQPVEQWARAWQRAIAHWAMALSDTGYWVAWGQQRSETYGSDFVYATVLGLAGRFQHYLAGLLTAERERAIEQEEADREAVAAQLQQDLAIEFSAVRLVNALGGIGLSGGRVACFGPLGMVELQAENALAGYCAQTRPSAIRASALPNGVSAEGALRRLRWMFSELRDVAVLADTDPAAALAAFQRVLGGAPCGHDDCPRHGKLAIPLRVPCPYAEDFSPRNPAYAALPNCASQLREDALLLAVDTRLRHIQVQVNRTAGATREMLQGEWQALQGLASLSADPAAGGDQRPHSTQRSSFGYCDRLTGGQRARKGARG